ncbi:MAG TPA: phenylalanine--tRNA ligase subunit beta [Solirubrobacteraceae bacterium]|jgi:phenylalanyl-tRNA synthetase beta chain
MRVPLEWLLEHCDPGLEVAEIESRLTMTGTKVEAIHHHGVWELERFVVGRVLSVEPHPDADRLRVCEVDLGSARPEGPAVIVCGAPNVALGQTVAVALPGAVMPDGTKLKAAKLRGVASEGMILAEDELAIGPGHKGIAVLNELAASGMLPSGVDLAPGAPLAQALPIATEVIELEITPNRPDCLGVYGVARELHAATGAPLAPPPWPQDGDEQGHADAATQDAGEIDGLTVKVDCPDLCSRFTARVFDGVKIAPSPPWLKARLSAAGQRPINNVVDITNYVMLLTGQPLHAFDLDRVVGGTLTVRRASAGERLLTLDGEQRTLDAEMVVIEDAEGPTSLAGVMGGSRSEVQEDTSTVAIEVANWHGPSIHRTSWALGLRSEASSRFEKGLAPEQCMQAQAVATWLMRELCGADPRPGTIDVCEPLPEPAQIRLRSRRVARVLGVPVSPARSQEILRALDFEASPVDGEQPPGAAEPDLDLLVTVPPLRRADVTREADLIEEVARIDGLERLPATLPARRGAYGMLSERQRLRRRAIDALVGRGLYEVLGWTFASPALADKLRLPVDHVLRSGAVALENPLSEEQALLRTTLIGSLLDIAARNRSRGVDDLHLFEVGTVFENARSETGVRERTSIAVLLTGRLQPVTWDAADPPYADFFAVKALLEALADVLRIAVDCQPCSTVPFLHPGRSAKVLATGTQIGWIGELHPEVTNGFELGSDGGGTGRPCAMELDLDLLIELADVEHAYTDLISFPALHRDLAVTLPVQVPAAEAIAVVRGAAGKLLASAEVFDVYTGPQVGEGRRSLALALSFRAPDRTLADEDVEPLRAKILAALTQIGGELRG